MTIVTAFGVTRRARHERASLRVEDVDARVRARDVGESAIDVGCVPFAAKIQSAGRLARLHDDAVLRAVEIATAVGAMDAVVIFRGVSRMLPATARRT